MVIGEDGTFHKVPLWPDGPWSLGLCLSGAQSRLGCRRSSGSFCGVNSPCSISTPGIVPGKHILSYLSMSVSQVSGRADQDFEGSLGPSLIRGT